MEPSKPWLPDESTFTFKINWWMPDHCQPKWWTEQTKKDGEKAGMEKCQGYMEGSMGCENLNGKWGKGSDGVALREFNCWFGYLGNGGDKSPPGSRSGVDGGVGAGVDSVLEAATEDMVTEQEIDHPRASDSSLRRRWWGALFRH